MGLRDRVAHETSIWIELAKAVPSVVTAITAIVGVVIAARALGVHDDTQSLLHPRGHFGVRLERRLAILAGEEDHSRPLGAPSEDGNLA